MTLIRPLSLLALFCLLLSLLPHSRAASGPLESGSLLEFWTHVESERVVTCDRLFTGLGKVLRQSDIADLPKVRNDIQVLLQHPQVELLPESRSQLEELLPLIQIPEEVPFEQRRSNFVAAARIEGVEQMDSVHKALMRAFGVEVGESGKLVLGEALNSDNRFRIVKQAAPVAILASAFMAAENYILGAAFMAPTIVKIFQAAFTEAHLRERQRWIRYIDKIQDVRLISEMPPNWAHLSNERELRPDQVAELDPLDQLNLPLNAFEDGLTINVHLIANNLEDTGMPSMNILVHLKSGYNR